MKGYIITEFPSSGIWHDWKIKDSVNGIVYDTFAEALTELEKINGCGIVQVDIDEDS